MSRCRAIVFRCADHRIHGTKLARALAAHGYREGDYDIFSEDGTLAKYLVTAPLAAKSFLVERLKKLVKEHGISEFVFLPHEDCAAYDLIVPNEELKAQIQDLHRATTFLYGHFKRRDLIIRAFHLVGVKEEREFTLEPLELNI